ncbi:adrenodoxin, mitochondrial-like [Meles meles]|uniref:adrenodoxin, mitochondrial-like n=1 Tax=Meles meles TaxID=9662 RepID=UPI001E69F468|nr:adrenodoxin, mitochondrial-like [Meles meles]
MELALTGTPASVLLPADPRASGAGAVAGSHSRSRLRRYRRRRFQSLPDHRVQATMGGTRLLRAASSLRPWAVGPSLAAHRWTPHLAERVGVRPAWSSSEDRITVPFVSGASETLTAKGKVDDSLLDVVRENNLDIDGSGACEGTRACSACHHIFEEHILEKLEAVTDEENGMLDLARRLTDLERRLTDLNWAAKSI